MTKNPFCCQWPHLLKKTNLRLRRIMRQTLVGLGKYETHKTRVLTNKVLVRETAGRLITNFSRADSQFR